MHARAIQVEERHWCALCGEIYDGVVSVWEGIHADTISENTYDDMINVEVLRSLDTCTMHSGECGCTAHQEDYEIYDLTEVWVCGGCKTEYVDQDDAAGCCL